MPTSKKKEKTVVKEGRKIKEKERKRKKGKKKERKKEKERKEKERKEGINICNWKLVSSMI